MAERFQIAAGEVIEVQLTSETYVIEGRPTPKAKKGKLQPLAGGRIANRMRVFLREADGKERNYDFADARIGLHDGHQAAVARGKIKGERDPINLMLVNFSTDERDLFERNIAEFLDKPALFGPIWKAVGLAALMLLIGMALSHFVISPDKGWAYAFWWAFFFSFLAFPIFWGITALWTRLTDRARYQRDRAKLIADIEGALKAHRPVMAG